MSIIKEYMRNSKRQIIGLPVSEISFMGPMWEAWDGWSYHGYLMPALHGTITDDWDQRVFM